MLEILSNFAFICMTFLNLVFILSILGSEPCPVLRHLARPTVCVLRLPLSRGRWRLAAL